MLRSIGKQSGNLWSKYVCMLQLIFSAEYTKAMDQDWHTSHFACFHCDLSLTGHRYVLRDEHAYCINCYESMFAHTCEECKTVIGTDSKVRSVTTRVLALLILLLLVYCSCSCIAVAFSFCFCKL